MRKFGIFLNKKMKQILVLIGIVILYFMASRFPYLNVLLPGGVMILPFMMLVLFLFKPSEKNIIIFASIITGVAIISSMLSFNVVLDIYGNVIFILLFYILVRNLNLLRK